MSRRSIESQAARTLLGRASWTKKVFALCLLALVACSAYLSVPDAKSAGLQGRVVAVADGDTVTVLDAGRQTHKIRLAFIDAPERSQAYGLRAKQALSDKVFQRDVTVTVYDKDQYGREVGRVNLNDQDINLAMVTEGYAWHYRYYAEKQQPAEAFKQYAAAQQQAQQERRGLWQDNNPEPPWDYRRQNKRQP